MEVLILSGAALLLSYFVNRWLLDFLGKYLIIFGAPFFEELSKTLPAYWTNRPIFLVHFLFGIGEALYDLVNSKEETGRWAAIFSIISHSFFGLVTVIVIKYFQNIVLGILAAFIFHCGWNWWIMSRGNKAVSR